MSSMPGKLTISPPRATSNTETAPQQSTTTITTEANSKNNAAHSEPPTTSPVAPAYSPITPKEQPTFPTTYPNIAENVSLEAVDSAQPNTANTQGTTTTIAPSEYIPQPPPRPFSSEDSTDAIALRAAISSLQFQRKKATEDIRALESIRRKALDDPGLFRSELKAGRLKEERPQVRGIDAVLDEESDDSEDDDDDDEVVVEASRETATDSATDATASNTTTEQTRFDRIPGPQNVVRMPHINWEKYHIHGEALDRLHEQRRKWPGSFDYGQQRGREFTVAAPYSPFLDDVGEERRDSAGAGLVSTPSTATSISEHPMETRRSVKDR